MIGTETPQKSPALFGRGLFVMGLGRVELPTSRLSGVRSNHLSYRPRQGTNQPTSPVPAQGLSAPP